MKKLLVFILTSLVIGVTALAQPGYVHTVAGVPFDLGDPSDGTQAAGSAIYVDRVVTDNAGNFYFSDGAKIRKVSPNGILSTVAGGGTLFIDGVPATESSLSIYNGYVALNANGDIFFSSCSSIRKVSSSTGLISTIAGIASNGGYTGDGGPATAAQIGCAQDFCFDLVGNLYFSDGSYNVVRKIDTAGIITTFAGNGTSGNNGDGGPATNAELYQPNGICCDAQGNIYIATGYWIRKVNTFGIISTYANCLSESVAIDASGNIFSSSSNFIYAVHADGSYSEIAGEGWMLTDNIPVSAASLDLGVSNIATDPYNNLYYCEPSDHIIRKVTAVSSPFAAAPAFQVYLTSQCAGPSINIVPITFSTGLYAKTWFGDGSIQVDTFSSVSVNCILTHTYNSSGTYTIKHIIYNSENQAIDSIVYSYNFLHCSNVMLQLYQDENTNCMLDSSESLVYQPVTIEVDSNNTAIDTISVTAGMYYSEYGTVGDVYSFKVLETNSGTVLSCPLTGIVYDTVGMATGLNTIKHLGFQCTSSDNFDLSVMAVIPETQLSSQTGHLYVQNAYCLPVNATATLHHTSKYSNVGYTDGGSVGSLNTITWNLNGSSLNISQPVCLNYSLYNIGVPNLIGDTVHSYFEITPTSGDVIPSDNTELIVDTIHGSWDPNEMWVSPNCIPSGASHSLLHYTINFENTGNDTAHNIYVLDTLPLNVDVSSLRIKMASHQMYTSKFTDAAGHTIMKFGFPSINLPDSSHHGMCDGAIIFDIQTKAGMADGAVVSNRAGIYFDVNPVVMTNATIAKVGGCATAALAAAASNTQISLYPNPASSELTITMSKGAYSVVVVTDGVGVQVMQQEVHGSTTKLNIASLPAGIYYINLEGDNGRKMMKFVKM